MDLGTPTPSPPPLAPLPDMGPPLGGMLSVIEEVSQAGLRTLLAPRCSWPGDCFEALLCLQ